MVPPNSHKVSRVSWYFGSCSLTIVFPYKAFTFYGRSFQDRSGNKSSHLLQSITPVCTHTGLGSFHFARRYFGNRVFFLFLRVLRCFSSPGSLCMAMYSPYSDWGLLSQVSPFRNLRVKGYLLLTVAYRSLSRLSSALSAKASTLCSYYLDLNFDFVNEIIKHALKACLHKSALFISFALAKCFHRRKAKLFEMTALDAVKIYAHLLWFRL